VLSGVISDRRRRLNSSTGVRTRPFSDGIVKSDYGWRQDDCNKGRLT
jgi:hypothetical protein